MSDIVKQLRDRACPAHLPWTGDNEREDHGHTDCWLHHQAADEIEQLRALITEWTDSVEAESKAFYGDLTDAIWRRSAAEKALFQEANR